MQVSSPVTGKSLLTDAMNWPNSDTVAPNFSNFLTLNTGASNGPYGALVDAPFGTLTDSSGVATLPQSGLGPMAAIPAVDNYAYQGSAFSAPQTVPNGLSAMASQPQDDFLSTNGPSSDLAIAPAANDPAPTPVANAQSVPLAIDQQTAAAAKDTTSANAQAAADTKATTGTNVGIIASIELFFQNIFIRFGVVILGIVFVAAALFLLYPKQTEAAVVAAVPK